MVVSQSLTFCLRLGSLKMIPRENSVLGCVFSGVSYTVRMADKQIWESLNSELEWPLAVVLDSNKSTMHLNSCSDLGWL